MAFLTDESNHLEMYDDVPVSQVRPNTVALVSAGLSQSNPWDDAYLLMTDILENSADGIL